MTRPENVFTKYWFLKMMFMSLTLTTFLQTMLKSSGWLPRISPYISPPWWERTAGRNTETNIKKAGSHPILVHRSTLQRTPKKVNHVECCLASPWQSVFIWKKKEKYYWKIETCDRCVWGHFIPRGWTATLVIAIYTRQYNTGSSQEERKRFHVIVRLQQSPLMHSVLIHNKVVSLGGVISSGNCARPQSCSISATKWRQSYDGYGGEIVGQKLIWSQRGLL